MGGVAKQQKQLLTKGSLVEVCTDEEGFTGAWFEATIVDPHPLPSSSPSTRSGSNKKNAKVYVEYVSLLSDEDGHKPLREPVNPSFIRPRPPSQNPKGFELYDVVDAYYRDGWWTGVVTGVLDSSRYTVTFHNPPDELEFGLSDLRFHRKWHKGKWVRPKKQKTAGLMFSVGKKVEVSFNSDDCCDAWFPSEIVEDSGNGSFLVKYQRSNAGNENELVRETVDALHIRPCPPLLKNKNFNLLDKVDAFYDFGWWSGVVNKVLADNSYGVFFKHENKERALNHSELRPHMEWKDGKWYASQCASVPQDRTIDEVDAYSELNVIQGVVESRSPGTTNETFGETISCSLKSDGDRSEQPSISIKKPSSRVSPMKRKQRVALPKKGISTPSPSLKKFKQKTDECETPTVNFLCGSDSQASKGTGSNVSISVTVDHLSDQPSQGRTRKRHRIDEHEGSISSTQRKKGRTIKLQTKGPKSSAQGLDSISPSGDKKPRRSYGKNRSDPIRVQKQNLSTPAKDGIKESEEDTLTFQRKKRGRPPKTLVSTPPSSDYADNEMTGQNCITNEAGLPGNMGLNSTGTGNSAPNNGDDKDPIKSRREYRKSGGKVKKMTLAKVSNEKNHATIKKSEKQTLKRGKRKTIGVNVDARIPDVGDTSGGNDAESVAIEEAIAEAAGNGFEDQPLSKWIEQKHPPTDVSRLAPAKNLEQHNDATEKCKESFVRNPAIGNGEVTTTSDSQSLPFVKNTLLWATIESMEVFQKIPQKPHFRPLEHSKDSSREGLAIGYMVTFSSVVDKARRLELDDPRSTIDEMLDTLRDLESHGFNVEVVRGRLNELLSLKDKQENLEGLLSDTCSEMENHKMEKAKIEEEVDELKKQIAKLEKKVSQAVSRKEAEEDLIDSKKSRMDELNQEIRNLRCDYEALTSKLL